VNTKEFNLSKLNDKNNIFKVSKGNTGETGP